MKKKTEIKNSASQEGKFSVKHKNEVDILTMSSTDIILTLQFLQFLS